MWSLCGAGELLMSLTLRVWVLSISKPANLTIDGLAPKIPLEPTVSKVSIINKRERKITFLEKSISLISLGLSKKPSLNFNRISL